MDTYTKTHWKETRTISTYDVDFQNKLRVDSIFNYIQEAAANSAEDLGWGYEVLSKHDLFWVLTRAKLSFNEFKSAGETIEIETWPKGLEGIFARRDSRIYGSDKKIICNATTTWLMIDRKTGRPVKSFDWLSKLDFKDKDEAIVASAEKISDPDTSELVYERQVRYMDIDVNNHVNNVRYVGYVLDCFSPDQFRRKNIANFQINYLNESKIGDVLIIRKSMINQSGNNYYIDAIKHDQLKVFQALIEWK